MIEFKIVPFLIQAIGGLLGVIGFGIWASKK